MSNNKFKIKDKLNIKNKIITILGETNIGKSMFLIILSFYLKNKNNKMLLIELNENNSNIYTILGCKKFNKIK